MKSPAFLTFSSRRLIALCISCCCCLKKTQHKLTINPFTLMSAYEEVDTYCISLNCLKPIKWWCLSKPTHFRRLEGVGCGEVIEWQSSDKDPQTVASLYSRAYTQTPISRQCQKKCMCLFPPPRPFLPQLFLLRAAFSCSAVSQFHCVKNIVQVAPCSGMCERLERQMGRQMYNAT